VEISYTTCILSGHLCLSMIIGQEMKHCEGTFKGTDGLELFYQSWQTQENAKATIAIIHGMGEHSNRYINIVNHFVPRGYDIFAFDLRGNGRSPGQRGYINSWTEIRNDINAFLNLIKRQSDTPLFILGHSLGGVVALDYCTRHSEGLQGVIASSPAIGKTGVPAIFWVLARILNRIWPRFSLNIRLDISNFSRDPAAAEAFKNDLLFHTRGTARLGVEVRHIVEWIHAHSGELRIPLLIVHGTDDKIASPDGSREYFQNVTFDDKELREYKGGYHELFNDIIKKQVLADTEQWLKRHL
jgi:alpha-beta hydrolase superfamily lysophospholipase